MTELICIVCPKGCHLYVDEKDGYKVSGNSCARGCNYGKMEMVNPTRVLTSTVCLEGGLYRRCPVKTDGAIPKALIFEAMRLLDDVRLRAPVTIGQIVVKDIFNTGVNFVVTRNMQSKGE